MDKTGQELYDQLYIAALGMFSNGFGKDDLEKELLKHSDDIVLVTVVITEARKTHYELCRKIGLRYILLGCLFGLAGFFITFLNFNTNRSISFAMYGLTTLGIGFVFWGLYKILG
ncbi:MAG: hypothetical protein JNL60_05235 [Bacteroidia bacterium]|nr:hypothetical protein [Bacteroidia bacterium]